MRFALVEDGNKVAIGIEDAYIGFYDRSQRSSLVSKTHLSHGGKIIAITVRRYFGTDAVVLHILFRLAVSEERAISWLSQFIMTRRGRSRASKCQSGRRSRQFNVKKGSR